jgi:hypothetical protein
MSISPAWGLLLKVVRCWPAMVLGRNRSETTSCQWEILNYRREEILFCNMTTCFTSMSLAVANRTFQYGRDVATVVRSVTWFTSNMSFNGRNQHHMRHGGAYAKSSSIHSNPSQESVDAGGGAFAASGSPYNGLLGRRCYHTRLSKGKPRASSEARREFPDKHRRLSWNSCHPQHLSTPAPIPNFRTRPLE